MIHRIHELDTVGVAMQPVEKGAQVECGDVTCRALDEIMRGHKMALRDIPKGEAVIKYGNQIGVASQDIRRGNWVHTHNLMSLADIRKGYTYEPDPCALSPGASNSTFLGYARKNGGAGTRNYIALISGSFCTNTHMTAFARMASEKFPKSESFDGFLPLTHDCGCGQMGTDLVHTRRTVASLIQNPNFGGVLFVELGCENNLFDTIEPYLESFDPQRFRKIHLQSEQDEYATAMRLLEELYLLALGDRRTPCPLSKLHIAENCGGSDGFSGITGNRLAGRISERLVHGHGATVNITEVPEMFGAEHILMNRARDRDTFRKVVDLIGDFKSYIERYGASANGNPSHGNKLGGISTIEEKSLGCIQKGGRCMVMDVVPYGHRAVEHGLNLVYGPGSDLVGVTAQIAAGANLVLFITGRGTPVAFASPTIKVATNSVIYEHKREWMDFNAGPLLDGVSIERMEQELFELILATAEGRYQASNERCGFYQIGILRDGVTL